MPWQPALQQLTGMSTSTCIELFHLTEMASIVGRSLAARLADARIYPNVCQVGSGGCISTPGGGNQQG